MRVGEQYVDYARFVLVGEPDRCATLMHSLEATYEQYCNASGEKATYRAKPLGSNNCGGRRYTWECWGAGAGFVVLLDYERWAVRLSRIDVCTPTNRDNEEIKASYEAATSEGASNRTVHLFTSPNRNKSGGRPAGGVGFAVGSHKSDLRLSLYKKQGELAKFEGQFSGAMLARAVSACGPKHTLVDDSVSNWEALVEVLGRWRDTRWEQAVMVAAPS